MYINTGFELLSSSASLLSCECEYYGIN